VGKSKLFWERDLLEGQAFFLGDLLQQFRLAVPVYYLSLCEGVTPNQAVLATSHV
jgi:hypothetical protein